jgi:ubiquinone/menaquinone biosynthesis C-methylase UbiE
MWSGEGKCLDIGTGSGELIIELAKRHPLSICTGFDYWGKSWGNSRQICEDNAVIEGVNNRVSFRQGTASQLPFENEQFVVVVSCLTFHEVKDTNDKILLLKEALRVLKKGGKFSFLDLFFDEKYYGEIDFLKKSLDNLGLENHSINNISEVINLPPILKHSRALGLAGVIFGTK